MASKEFEALALDGHNFTTLGQGIETSQCSRTQGKFLANVSM